MADRSFSPKKGSRCIFPLSHARFQHKVTPLSSFVGSAIALGGLVLANASFTAWTNLQVIIFVGSFAALATLLFAAPAGVLASPRNTICGHVVSVIVALILHWLSMAVPQVLTPVVLTILVPAAAICCMTVFQVQHPPAAACAVIFVTGGGRGLPGYVNDFERTAHCWLTIAVEPRSVCRVSTYPALSVYICIQ